MGYVTEIITLLVWTGMCCVLVYGLELFLGLFGYDAGAVDIHQPPVTPESPEE